MELSPAAKRMLGKKVEEMVGEQLTVDPQEVVQEAHLTDDLGADSLDIVELVMAFEEEFNLEIPDEDAEMISTVSDITNYLAEHGFPG